MPDRSRPPSAIRADLRARLITSIALAALICVIAYQWRKAAALMYLEACGELSDWELFGLRLGPLKSTKAQQFNARYWTEIHAVLAWFPGTWPRSLAINKIPESAERYADAIQRLPGLDMIMVFVYQPMDIKVFEALGSVKGVKYLDLTSNSVTDAAFGKFMQFSTAERLYLSESAITDASVPSIVRFQRITDLDIANNAISPERATEIGRMPSLQHLYLDERIPNSIVETMQCDRPDLNVSN